MASKPWWRETLETVFWALILAVILRTFVVQAFWIPSGSMIPTLEIKDRVLVCKFWYHVQKPQRGQVVVFKYPVDPKRDFVKRIVGLPGDHISMEDGIVFVNGTPLEEPYIMHHDSYDMGEIVVPKGQYFVLGDNRPNSQDGRFWPEGTKFVPKAFMKGPAFFRYWPLNRMGLVR